MVLQEAAAPRACGNVEINKRRGENLGGETASGLKRSDKAAHGVVGSLPRHRQRQRMPPLHTFHEKMRHFPAVIFSLVIFGQFSAARRHDFRVPIPHIRLRAISLLPSATGAAFGALKLRPFPPLFLFLGNFVLVSEDNLL